MTGNEQTAQLPVVWLLRDVVSVVIGHIASHATKQAKDYNCEPPVHFVILSSSACQAGLFSQRKRKSKQRKRRTLATIRTRWDGSRGLSLQRTTSVAIGAIMSFSGSSIFHRLAFAPNAFVMSSRDRRTASSIELANTQCRNRSLAPARLHHTQYVCDPWQLSIETALFMITPSGSAPIIQDNWVSGFIPAGPRGVLISFSSVGIF
jgi:hypothetical protein